MLIHKRKLIESKFISRSLMSADRPYRPPYAAAPANVKRVCCANPQKLLDLLIFRLKHKILQI